MAATYTTEQGDCWDLIAHKVYGDTRHTGFLMAANFRALDKAVFDAGGVLSTPPLTETEQNTALPFWRAET